MPLLRLILLLLSIQQNTQAIFNNVVRTPPMGWLSSSRFANQLECTAKPDTCIGSQLIERTVKGMRDHGLISTGYRYLVLDQDWSSNTRDPSTNQLQYSSSNFPKKPREVGFLVRQSDMLFGLQFDAHCPESPNTDADAQSTFDWSLDYVTIKGCTRLTESSPYGFGQIGGSLKKLGRPIPIACTGIDAASLTGEEKTHIAELIKTCDIWRIVIPTKNSKPSISETLTFLKSEIDTIASTRRWIDLGPLRIGHSQTTPEEQQLQMGVWCLFASPLFVSIDFQQVKRDELGLLKNPRLIAIDQDVGGRLPKFVKEIAEVQIWSRELLNKTNTWAIAFVNLGTQAQSVTMRLYEMKITRPTVNSFHFELTDVFTGDTMKLNFYQSHVVAVPPGAIVMYYVQPVCCNS